jgi:uncharacterized membrane protein
MNREKFIAELRRSLGRMTEKDRSEALYDYEEHFRMGAVDGKTEEQIAASLGNPRSLGASYAIDMLLEAPREGGAVRAASVVRAVFASVSLTFFNIIFVLGPFLGLVAVMIGLWSIAPSLALSGLALFLAPLAGAILPSWISLGGLHPALLVFTGIALAGLGVLCAIGMWQLSRLFVKMIAAYVRFNARVVTRRK